MRFSAEIFKIGINPVINPPENVLKALFKQAGKTKGPIPVRGTINGAAFIQTLVKYRGAWRLYINGPMLKTSKSKVGDTADIEIEFDPTPRETPVPEELEKALSKDAAALRAFETLTPSRRKDICRYIGSLSSKKAVEKNIQRVLEQLRDDK